MCDLTLIPKYSENAFLEPPRIRSPIPVRSPTPPPLDVPDSRPLSPAWDPAAPTPFIRGPTPPPAEPSDVLPPTWILDEEFSQSKKFRILLRDDFGAGPEAVFDRLAGDRVLFTNSSIYHPVSTLRHATPRDVGDLVVAIEGPYRATILKVQTLGPTECTVSEYGVRRRGKNYEHPVIKTACLARIRRI